MAPEPPAPANADKIFRLEVFGTPPADTVVTFPAGQRRVIKVFHQPPDFSVFAELDFPAGALTAAGRDSVTLTIRVLPGLYGLTLGGDAEMAAPGRLTFRYPVHFSEPADAEARYPSNASFERALWIGRLEKDDMIRFLPSTRPSSDNLSALIPSLGTYLVATPR